MLEKDQLIQTAIDQTGLNDFDGDNFQEALQRLVDALNAEAKLSESGVLSAELAIVAGLRNRLKIYDYIQQHPDVLEQEIVKPVFIVGLPRTGTTALHHMLNQDSANHTLRAWEAQDPVPPPEEATYRSDPRIEKQRQELAMTEQSLPGFSTTHLMGAEEPDECYVLLSRHLMSVEFSALYHIPSYANWLYAQDLTESYAYHKLQLKLLQYKKSGRWILKAPCHQLGLEAILHHYPDATIVQTHRAPMRLVGSGCSFSELVRKTGSDHIDPLQVGQDWMDMLKAYTRTFEAAREKLEPNFPEQFVDMHHDAFVEDPWPTIETVYEKGQCKLSDGARAAMQSWRDENPKGKHGKHEYRLERYGMSRADVEAVFGDYARRYNLPME